MARSLLVAPVADHAAMARTCLGLLRALDRRGVKVAYVKPVAQPRADGRPDQSSELVAAITALRPPEPVTTAQLEELLGEGELDVVLEKIVAAWKPVYGGSDVVVIQGLSSGPSRLYASSLNQALARALDADVVLAGSWPADGDAEELAEQFAIAASGYMAGEQARVVGCVIHGLPAADAAAAAGLRAALARRQLAVAAEVPYRPELTWPRIRDLVRHLHPQILHEGDMSRRIRDVAVFAAGIPGGLHALDTGRLVVVPGDRHDVIMAAYLTELSGTRLAGLLLSTGTAPDPRISELTRATSAAGLPVLLVPDDSYQTATRVRDLDPGLPADDLERIESVTDNIADALDPSWLESLTGASRSRRLSPAAFRYQLAEQARAADALVVLPEGTEPRTIRAAVACAERGIARCLLLGSPGEVAARAGQLGLRLPEGVTVLDPQAVAERYVDAAGRAAPAQGLDRGRGPRAPSRPGHGRHDDARTRARSTAWYPGRYTPPRARSARRCRSSGPSRAPAWSPRSSSCACPTRWSSTATAPSTRSRTPRTWPTSPSRARRRRRMFGIEPRVAMISFSTGTSGTGSDVDKVAEATRIVREREPDLPVDGPLQYDAAAIASVGQAKRPGSPVAGRASVFVFPDLDTGNTTYKAVQRSARVVSIGPMLQGLAKPVNDLSRGALVEDIIYTIALTAIQARAT